MNGKLKQLIYEATELIVGYREDISDIGITIDGAVLTALSVEDTYGPEIVFWTTDTLGNEVEANLTEEEQIKVLEEFIAWS